MTIFKASRRNVISTVFIVLLALCMVVTPITSVFGGTSVVYAEDGDGSGDAPSYTAITGSTTIDGGGYYKLDAALSNAIITIATKENVNIIGNGLGNGATSGAGSTANNGVSINCTVAGVSLNLYDVFIGSPNSSIGNAINFIGEDNVLAFAGTCDLETQGNYALIHVPPSAELYIGGSGTVYLYKSSSAAGIGGNNEESSGPITVDGPTLFFKGSKMGALIGSGGYNSDPAVTPGDITILSGEINFIGNARGAVIGTGATSSQTLPGNVYIKGGTINMNLDFAGSAIGRGDGGLDGGKVFFSGGSIRTFIDENALGSWRAEGVNSKGVTPIAIRAEKLDASGDNAAHMLSFDTELVSGDNTNFNVSIDEKPFYNGGLHKYFYLNEDKDKDLGEQLSITTTQSNWVLDPSPDTNLYFYVTGQDHTLKVNGQTFAATWDAATSSFDVAPAGSQPADPTVWDGTTKSIDWYLVNPESEEFVLNTASDFAGFASITNGTILGDEYPEGFLQDSFKDKTVKLATDVDLQDHVWQEIGAMASAGSGGTSTGALPPTTNATSFQGIFDGQGHTIAGLNVPRPEEVPMSSDNDARANNKGLFGRVEIGAVVKNVGVTSGIVSGARFVGGIAGTNWGTIENCFNGATVTSNGQRGSGGIAGANYNNGGNVTISNCYNYGEIISLFTASSGSHGIAGGITGTNEKLVENCYNVGTITSIGSNYGGIAGYSNQKVNDSYVLDTSTDKIVTGTSTFLIGGVSASAADLFKTEEEMMSKNFVTSLGDAYSMDIEGINAGFPILAWQGDTPVVVDDPKWDGESKSYEWYTDNTEKDNYIIATAADLAGLAAIVNGTADGIVKDDFAGKTITQAANFVLDEDGLFSSATGRFGQAGSDYQMDATYYIPDPNSNKWTPIGLGVATANNTYSTANYFAGTFDGAGFSISGLYTDGTLTTQGLFGCVTGTIKNVNVTSGLVASKIVAGGIAAYLNGGTVEGCSNAAHVYADGGQAAGSGLENGISRGGAIGGIVGNVAGTDVAPFLVKGNSNSGNVICTNTRNAGRVGGIIGLIDVATYAGSIKNNLNSGYINGYQYVGGIVGMNFSKVAPIDGCVNYGNIQVNSPGSPYGGGIVSHCYSDVSNCYNTGNYIGALVTRDKTSHLGGIVSDLFAPGKITNCYSTGQLELLGTAVTASSTGRIVGAGGGKVGTAAQNVYRCYSLDITSELPEFADVEQGWLPEDSTMSAADMKSNKLVWKLGDAFNLDASGDDAINGGFPVLAWQGGVVPPAAIGEAGSGDLNGDGFVTLDEVITLIKFIAGSTAYTPEQLAVVDMDGDGILSMIDVVRVIRIIIGY